MTPRIAWSPVWVPREQAALLAKAFSGFRRLPERLPVPLQQVIVRGKTQRVLGHGGRSAATDFAAQSSRG
jgi:hypothetical protein